MFITKKIGNKYSCFGPGMKKLSGGYLTNRQALAALKKHKDEHLAKTLPALVKTEDLQEESPLSLHSLREGPKLSITEESGVLSQEDTKTNETIAEIEAMTVLEAFEKEALRDMATKKTPTTKGPLSGKPTSEGMGKVPADQGLVFTKAKPEVKATEAKTKVKLPAPKAPKKKK